MISVTVISDSVALSVILCLSDFFCIYTNYITIVNSIIEFKPPDLKPLDFKQLLRGEGLVIKGIASS